MYANAALLVALLLVTPFVAGSPLKALPVQLQSSIGLGAQKNMDIHVPEGATSVTADTIQNLAIVIAETVYIMADGTVVPENPGTTVPTLPTAAPTVPTGGVPGTPIITPPTFPGRK